MGEAEVMPGRELAINPGSVYGEVSGTPTTDPAFGLEAVWVEPLQREQAQTLGYTVVDASTVVATHLSQMLQDNAHELIGHDEVQQLLEVLKRESPKLVENLTPKPLGLNVIARVLQNLLQEQVAIRDMRTIAETLADHGQQSQDVGILTALTRVALGRQIVQGIFGLASELSVMALHPSLEQILQSTVQPADEGGVGFEPGLAEQLQQALSETASQQEMAGQESILLVAGPIRAWMSRFVKHSVPGMNVLSYNEIPDNRQIKVVATIGKPNAELEGGQ